MCVIREEKDDDDDYNIINILKEHVFSFVIKYLPTKLHLLPLNLIHTKCG